MVNIAVLGCGKLGTAHADALAGLDGVTVRALCDPVLDNAERLRTHDGLERALVTTDPGQVMADDDIDAVWITTPNDSHLDLTTAAIHAGKHVFVEKPLARTMAECAAIVELARRGDRLVMSGYKMRFFPMVELAREAVPDPISVQVQVLDGRWPEQGWVSDPLIGGGNITSQGCHGTDLIRHLVGRDPEQVYAVGGRFYSERVPTNLSAVYRFADDVSASFTVGDADTPPVTSKFFAQVVGDGISATLTDRLTRLTVHRRGEQPEVHAGPEIDWVVEDSAFVEAIRAGGPAPVDALDGWWATAMTESAIRSAESGEPVDLAPPVG